MKFYPRVSRRLERGFSLLESLCAIVILAIAFLAWSGGMIIATDGENKAATHTQAISAANQILEYMRRDPSFWSSSEFSAGSCPHCWPTAYNDAIGVSAPRPCSVVIANAPPNCSFNWLAIADPNSTNLADLTVVISLKGSNNQTEHYTIMGMARDL
jgi:prepilin-type N-terminal cleavage/methylation domain-containing protein